MSDVEMREVTVDFCSVVPLREVSLSISHGEIFFLIGPSGCGKTTLLRAIAGLQPLSGGKILFGSSEVTNMPIAERGVGMVFQSYCLWPHMTVVENIAFGLQLRKVSKAEEKDRVREILKVTELAAHQEKYPHQLSGGQQQRVALARALVLRPHVLLLDEPFSNLDVSLRASIREAIRGLRHTFDLTMIFVTHDFEEAMNLGDRVACLESGKIGSLDTPEAFYRNPKTFTAARLSGSVQKVPKIFTPEELYARPEAFSINFQGKPNAAVKRLVYESSFIKISLQMLESDEIIEIVSSRAERVPEVLSTVAVEARPERFFELRGLP